MIRRWYSGGPTEILAEINSAMADEATYTAPDPQVGETLENTETTVPEGTTYHLNSKRLKTRQLKRIAAALGITESASAEDTRTIIEGKLREMDTDPSEVQVIIQEGDKDNGTLFLMNNEGVILTVEAPIEDSHIIPVRRFAQCTARQTCITHT